jgi:hypothetical protein
MESHSERARLAVPVGERDHIRGTASAETTLVECTETSSVLIRGGPAPWKVGGRAIDYEKIPKKYLIIEDLYE